MSNLQNSDFQNCLSAQPRRDQPPVSKATQKLASELLVLVKDDSNKAMAIIKQIMYYSPNKSIDWYCEQAVAKLNRQLYDVTKAK